MINMEYAIAVLDIGKTNKKLVIYDDSLNQVDSVFTSIPAINHEELEVENVDEIEKWFLENLKSMGVKYPIKSISISTHGATCSCIDDNGELSVPVVAYTNEVDEILHSDFYRNMGDPDTLQRQTGTAQVKPLINLGKLIYFLQTRFPDRFDNTKSILFYPQYFGYRLTGTVSADFTYAGCHTYLWDFKKWSWSNLCDKLGIRENLPVEVKRPGEVLGTISPDIAERTGLSSETEVTVGIHDSNSSLIPYLVKDEKNFVLNSTGTWCVLMHPSEIFHFDKDEIGKTVFYNISARENLVKTAIFMGGLEFETHMKHILKASGTKSFPVFDKDDVQRALNCCNDFIIPGIVRGAGQFPQSEPRVVEGEQVFPVESLNEDTIPSFFRDLKYAYAVLNLSLAIQTKVALDRIKPPDGSPIYIEGGFRKNDVYIKLLAFMYPHNPVYTTDIKEATSLGAAMLSKVSLEKKELEDLKDLVSIEMNRVEPESFSGFDEYMERFLSLV